MKTNAYITRSVGILGLCLLMLFGSSCRKHDGTVRFTNTSPDPYFIYLDNRSEGTLFGNTFIEFRLMEGDHTVEAIQQSGFLGSPHDVKSVVHVVEGNATEFVFP